MKNQLRLMPRLLHRLLIMCVLLILIINSLPSMFAKQSQITIASIAPIEAQLLSSTLAKSMQRADELGLVVSVDNQSRETHLLFSNQASEPTVILSQLRSELEGCANITLDSVSSVPTWLGSITSQPIKLGLDLSGGALFVLEVDTQTAIAKRLEDIALALQTELRSEKLRGVRVNSSSYEFISLSSYSGFDDKFNTVMDSFVRNYPGLMSRALDSNNMQLAFDEFQFKQLEYQYVEQAITTMRGRIEQLGITEGVVQLQGKNRIRIEIPGIKDLEQAERLIGATASLTFYQFAQYVPQQARYSIEDSEFGRLTLAALPIFTGSNITDAQSGRDEYGQPLVNLVLDNEGGQKMSDFSKHNVGRPMATVFSEYQLSKGGIQRKTERVINVATIQTHLGNRFSLTNLNSPQEAHELALLLRAGSLDSPVNIVEKRIISASLGERNVSNGFYALGFGLAMTMILMFVIYGRLGVIANLALATNIGCLLGLMAMTPSAVLTLPGIAGLVLTVGMAVDTNVLIFERIRQEHKRGVPSYSAVYRGFQRAWGTILDANLTTLICALVMLSIGYGPVKGFAITLAIGLVSSVFAGVAVSQLLFAIMSPHRLLPIRQEVKQ